jgi:hypothetical protein
MLIPAGLDIGSLLGKATLSVIIAAILGVIWVKFSSRTKDWLAQRRGEIRGDWFGILPEVGNAPERIDEYRIRQRGQRLMGEIHRIRPDGRKGKWKISGYMHGSVVVCVFHTTTPGNDPSSYGVICVHRVPGLGEESLYRGYYTRPEFEAFERFREGSLTTRPIIWQRKHPDQMRYDI